jgi:hypothetical protein
MLPSRAVRKHAQGGTMEAESPRCGPASDGPRRVFGRPRNVFDPGQRDEAAVPEGRARAAVAESQLDSGVRRRP